MEDVSGEMGPHPRGDTALPTQLAGVSTATCRSTPQPRTKGLNVGKPSLGLALEDRW